MNDEQLEADYLSRAAQRLAPTSLAGYRQDLSGFRRELQAAGHWPGWRKLTASDVREAFNIRQQAGQSVATQQRLATSLRQFYRDLVAQGQLGASPMVGLRPGGSRAVKPARRKSVATGLTYDAMMALAPKLLVNADRREAALLTLLITTGLRSGEVATLRDDQFDWDLDILLVQDRSGRARYIPVDEQVHRTVVAYQERRRPVPQAGTLFTNRNGAPVRTAWVAQTLRRLSAGQLTPAGIRKLVIGHWVTTAGVARAAQLAGHHNLNAIAAYQAGPVTNLRKNYHKYYDGGNDDDHD